MRSRQARRIAPLLALTTAFMIVSGCVSDSGKEKRDAILTPRVDAPLAQRHGISDPTFSPIQAQTQVASTSQRRNPLRNEDLASRSFREEMNQNDFQQFSTRATTPSPYPSTSHRASYLGQHAGNSNEGRYDSVATLFTQDEEQEGPDPSENRGLPTPPPVGPATSQQPDEINMTELPGADEVDINVASNLISLHVRSAPLNTVLAMLAQELGISLVASSDVDAEVSITLTRVELTDALDAITSIAGCSWTNYGGIIRVSNVGTSPMTSPVTHGRQVRVFELSFASATDVHEAISGLLTPIGQCFINATDPADERRTREQLIVEDVPSSLDRVAQLVEQLDQPPQQVLIMAHVLQVTLDDEHRHGVSIFTNDFGDVEISTNDFTNPLAPGGFFTIDGANVSVLIELIRETTDSKTLASPKVMVINGQMARIQIGERLGYRVTTTTETSTLQDVQFLDVGVVLEVTPQIANDGRVLLNVKPKVSGGQVTDGLPEEETTEIETTVMLTDGRGVVIGGLIQEIDDDQQSKLPWLGDMWLIGRLFQRRAARKERQEIIVALVPYVVPSGIHLDEWSELEWARASTRLFEGPLDPVHRPWESQLPDAREDPRRIRYDRIRDRIPNLRDSHPNPTEYYVPRASRNDRYFPNQPTAIPIPPQNGMSPSYHEIVPEVHYGEDFP